jgi:hypothetical protein
MNNITWVEMFREFDLSWLRDEKLVTHACAYLTLGGYEGAWTLVGLAEDDGTGGAGNPGNVCFQVRHILVGHSSGVDSIGSLELLWGHLFEFWVWV